MELGRGEVYTFIHLFSKGEGTHVEVRDRLMGVTSLPCGPWVSNLGLQASGQLL